MSLSFFFPLFLPVVLMSDPGLDVSGPSQLASDSDSEVYCDSVDQFGQEEASSTLKLFSTVFVATWLSYMNI